MEGLRYWGRNSIWSQRRIPRTQCTRPPGKPPPQSGDCAPTTLHAPPTPPATTATPAPPSSDTTGTNVAQINRNRVVGFTSQVLGDATTPSITGTNRCYRLHSRGRQDDSLARTEPSQTSPIGKDTRFLAIMSDTPMDMLLAQDMFSTFM